MSLEIISRALDAAAADGSLAEFYSDLVSCGGRFVAGMLEEAVEVAVCREEKKKETSSTAASAAAAAAGAASYERLHSGPWHAVPAAWRDAYTLACLLQVADAEEEEGGDDSKRKREKLRLLDLALLLGGRRFRSLAHSAAAALSAALRETSSHGHPSSPLLPEAWPLPATPVELPPGSLGASEMGARVEAAVPSFHSSSSPSPPPSPLLSLEDFVARATAPDPTPFLLPSCVSSWPALSIWSSPRYWDGVAGERTVPVEVGASYLEGDWSQELQTLRAFLDDHVFLLPPENAASSPDSKRKKTGYLAQHDLLEQVPELARDVLTPDYVLSLPSQEAEAGGEDGEGVARNLWLGPAGTLSPLHTDPKRNLLCQVFGRKYVRLYRPDERSSAALLQAGRDAEGDGEKKEQGGSRTVTDALTAANTSRADLFSPSEPVAALRFLDVVLNPGDALFIPKGWWHFVLSLEPSASVSFWF